MFDLGKKNPLTENLSKLQRPQIHKDQKKLQLTTTQNTTRLN
jgi:hypothetical protein